MFNIENELAKFLSEELQNEIDNDIIHTIIVKCNSDWLLINNIDKTELTTAWISNNNLSRVCKFTGRAWLFKHKKDAELFVLKFS
jgi:hypothetical protein